MKITFLRHAEAEDSIHSDFERRLTPKGLKQAQRVGCFCREAGLLPDLLLASPVVRARQTAEIVAKALGNPPLRVESWLACGMSPATCLRQLAALDRGSSVMLVGHEPDLSETLELLLGMENGGIPMRKACLAAVDLCAFTPGGGRLEFLIPARLMVPKTPMKP